MLSKMCIAAANYLITKTNEFNKGKKYSERISMTCKRLQKLLYFSEIEYMKSHNGKNMFTDEFHAWPNGPVIPSVYDVFVQYQNGEMYPVSEKGHSSLTKEMEKTLDRIFERTQNIDTLDLVDMSHKDGGPWSKAYVKEDEKHENIISKGEMLSFYQKIDYLTK